MIGFWVLSNVLLSIIFQSGCDSTGCHTTSAVFIKIRVFKILADFQSSATDDYGNGPVLAVIEYINVVYIVCSAISNGVTDFSVMCVKGLLTPQRLIIRIKCDIRMDQQKQSILSLQKLLICMLLFDCFFLLFSVLLG